MLERLWQVQDAKTSSSVGGCEHEDGGEGEGRDAVSEGDECSAESRLHDACAGGGFLYHAS